MSTETRAVLAQTADGIPADPLSKQDPTDDEILAALRPLYGDQSAADMGAEDDLRTARAVLARWCRPAAAPVAGIDPNLQDTITWLLEETESAIADDCPVAAGRLTRAATLLQQQAARITELEAAAPPPRPPRLHRP